MVISGVREEDGQEFFVCTEETGQTLLAILQEHGIFADAPCNGNGSCGACRVRFLTKAPDVTETEKKLLGSRELANGVRLACRVKPEESCRIQILADGQEQMQILAPENAQTAADGGFPSYGAAVDIGTTTLVMALIDLTTGEQKAVTTSVNHQRAYGADVISRIQAANAGKAGLLQKSILSDLRRMCITLVRDARIQPSQIKRMVIVGNTTMCHLLLGYSTRTLGTAPFVPYDLSLVTKKYREIFHSSELSAEVTVFPGISAFVGADIVAGIYAAKMAESEEPAMLLDIGTNGEMVLGNRDGYVVTSTAAGPVFEGGNISCGMPGVYGAISHVGLSGSGSVLRYETIGGKPPKGLCGSGVIDMTGELVRNRLVDENGTLKEPWFSEGVPVVKESIRFLQRDIREIQLAKSAIRAGIETLLADYGQQTDAPKRIYLSGGFGYFMDIGQAIQIGILPESFAGRATILGNSALEGAKRFLLEESADVVTGIVARARERNLAVHPGFEKLYMEHLFF